MIPAATIETIGGVFLGVSYALGLVIWFRENRMQNSSTFFLEASVASVVMAILYFILNLLPRGLGPWCALLAATCSFALSKNSPPSPCGVQQADDKTLSPKEVLFPVGLALGSGMARTLLTVNWVLPTHFDMLWAMMPFSVIVVIIAVSAARVLTPLNTLSAIVAVVCLSIICALLISSTSAVLSSAIYAGGWFLLAYSVAGSAWFGSRYATRGLRVFTLCLAGIFLSNDIVLIATFSIPQHSDSLLTIAAVLLVLSLACIALSSANEMPIQKNPEGSSDESKSPGWCEAVAAKYELTERERDVFVLLAQGYSLKAISSKLFISYNTAKSHRSHIYRKLGVSSRQDIIDLAERETGRAI